MYTIHITMHSGKRMKSKWISVYSFQTPIKGKSIRQLRKINMKTQT